MVLAGEIPNQATFPIERLHQQTSNLILATSLMIVFLFWSIVTNFGVSTYSILLPLVVLILIWQSFKSRKSYGIILAQLELGLASAVFALFGIAHVAYGLAGSILDLILGGLMIYMTFSSFKRISLLNNFIFISWYNGDDVQTNFGSNLNTGEMLAMCPNCSSVLAIQPELLSLEDECPNCSKRLVTSEIIEEE